LYINGSIFVKVSHIVSDIPSGKRLYYDLLIFGNFIELAGVNTDTKSCSLFLTMVVYHANSWPS